MTFGRTALVLAMVVGAPMAATAATVLGDGFDVELSLNGEPLGPVSGVVAGSGDPDLDEFLSFSGGEISLQVEWVDDDSFDFTFFSTAGADLDVAFTLSGLDFAEDGAAVPITGAAFNRGDSNVDEFEAGPGFADPLVGFADDAVTASYFFDAALAGDGPRLRFDVTAGDGGPAPIPLPASLPLLGAAVLGLAGLRRLRRRR